jgi:hypothetical protein
MDKLPELGRLSEQAKNALIVTLSAEVQRLCPRLTFADPLLGNQSSGFRLPECVGRLLVRVYLVPAQHLDDPVIGNQVEPQAFGFPPLPCPAGALGPNLAVVQPLWNLYTRWVSRHSSGQRIAAQAIIGPSQVNGIGGYFPPHS